MFAHAPNNLEKNRGTSCFQHYRNLTLHYISQSTAYQFPSAPKSYVGHWIIWTAMWFRRGVINKDYVIRIGWWQLQLSHRVNISNIICTLKVSIDPTHGTVLSTVFSVAIGFSCYSSTHVYVKVKRRYWRGNLMTTCQKKSNFSVRH